MNNIFEGIPQKFDEEIFEDLIRSDKIRIERIVSKGHISPNDFWYNQEENEWVIIIKGEARIKFHDGEKIFHLSEGDYLNIPRHTKHRVEWTDLSQETIWVAVFY